MTHVSQADVSSAVGDYLKALWTLGRNGKVSTNAIAKHLGVTAGSVSGMLARLAELGLVSYVKYRGARLTQVGEAEAVRLVRRHRLIETFMIRELGYGWDEVHDEAEMLEHVVSDRFAERLAVLLGDPSHDPHGDPIPRVDGVVPSTPDERLSDLEAGQVLRVARLRSQDAHTLAWLEAQGLKPGSMLRVTSVDAGSGERIIEVHGTAIRLEARIAERVCGERMRE